MVGISSLRRVLITEVKVGRREKDLENEETSSIVRQLMNYNTENSQKVMKDNRRLFCFVL